MKTLGYDENIYVNQLMGEKESLSLTPVSWDELYTVDKVTGNGFDITEPTFKKVKGVYVKREYGTHSRLFGTDFEDDEAFAERYSCRCGERKSRKYEGEICPKCNTVVEYIGINMKMTGWMSLENGYAFIHPIYYLILQSLIGKDAFNEMIKYDMDIDLNGHVVQKHHPKNKFYGIGISLFREKFIDIMAHYMRVHKRKPDKLKVIDELLVIYEYGLLFQSHIPVYSSMLRDTKITNEEYWYNEVDKKINMLFSQVRLLNGWRVRSKKESLEALPNELALSNLQTYLMKYWSIVYSGIMGKDGLIKDGILGGRLNFSARDVIVPDPTLRVNEVKVGYILFLELFKLELINLLVRLKGITYMEAFEEWSLATTHFDEKMWMLMNHYIKKNKPMIILNRNPSINFGSLMAMYILEVEPGYVESFVLRMPVPVLSKFNADFDGDHLNLVSLKLEEHVKEFKKYLEPRSAMQISRVDGKFDTDFGLGKDQIIGLHYFNTI